MLIKNKKLINLHTTASVTRKFDSTFNPKMNSQEQFSYLFINNKVGMHIRAQFDQLTHTVG